jgi:hypothetical protein
LLLFAGGCRCVLTGAQLLAEGLSDKGGFAAGFDWAEEQLRQAGLGKIAAEVRGLYHQSKTVTVCASMDGQLN